ALVFGLAASLHADVLKSAVDAIFEETVSVERDGYSTHISIPEGDAASISIVIREPSSLPPNARLLASWTAVASGESGTKSASESDDDVASARGEKVLHGFDPSAYVTWGLERGRDIVLRIAPLVEGRPFDLRFATDDGAAPLSSPFPERTPWPDDLRVDVDVRIEPRHGTSLDGLALLETEPNDGPATADVVPFPASDEDVNVVVYGGQDDADWVVPLGPGSGDRSDWLRIEHRGSRRKLLTANLQLVDPVVAGALHAWRLSGTRAREDGEIFERGVRREGGRVLELLPDGTVVEAVEHTDGRDPNERPHQQDDRYRNYITRYVEPGEVYFIEVEANQPGWELDLRLIDPAPYDNPARAVEQGMYYHLAEVSAWMIHKPRGNALYKRLRDGTNLFGETCMSCHAQSGVWGVAETQASGFPIAPGVRRSWSRLIDQMYASARPTNTIADASINTSTPPADFGDGLAGTRVLGRNVAKAEMVRRPSLLRARQRLRIANFVLATTDPKAVNAAGRGANFGPNVVLKFAGEILRAAWDDTGDPRYLRGLEDKARDVLDPENEKRNNAVVDDLGHRIELVHAVWPDDYIESVERLASDARYAKGKDRDSLIEAARTLDAALRAQASNDVERLLELQREDGSWAFELDGSGREGHPAPTAVSLLGLHAAGFDREHPAVDRALRYLVSTQTP
ncbi:MAG TPA: hypothetical protein VK116_04085, partial [Planctomycetota bacterium]|nr:hypothetical protein [Planctomycetota bacterium]